jgi:hypothetical protein
MLLTSGGPPIQCQLELTNLGKCANEWRPGPNNLKGSGCGVMAYPDKSNTVMRGFFTNVHVCRQMGQVAYTWSGRELFS